MFNIYYLKQKKGSTDYSGLKNGGKWLKKKWEYNDFQD